MPVARKSHGPCDGCGEEIAEGHAYRRTLRPAGSRERSAVFRYGRPMVSVKRHVGCRGKERETRGQED